MELQSKKNNKLKLNNNFQKIEMTQNNKKKFNRKNQIKSIINNK